MATSCTLNHKLDELLKCPVCLDTFTEPRTLACLHTFCTDCLEGCRRFLRRDIECPVCKRISSLPQAGVRGLPTDYRIEQIREFFSDMQTSDAADGPPAVASSADSVGQCDVCKTQQKVAVASQHCVQCLMQLCDDCVTRHNSNAVLATHQLIAVTDTRAVLAMYCSKHSQHAVRYFCAECRVTLCSICTIEHDPAHKPESLEQGVLETYRSRLTDKLRALTTYLSFVKVQSKRIDAVRQTSQNHLYTLKQQIHDQSERIVARVRQREAALIVDAQARCDVVLNSDALSGVAELEFRKLEIEKLISDVRGVLAGPPLTCLLAFDEIAGRVCRLTNPSLYDKGTSSSFKRLTLKPINFVSAPDVDIVIGWFQEVGAESGAEPEEPQSTSTSCSPPRSSSETQPTAVARKRTASILNAVSPVRKFDSRGSRLKGVARQIREISSAGGDVSDCLAIPTTSTSAGGPSSPSTTVEVTPAPSPSTALLTPVTAAAQAFQPRLLFAVTEVGVLQGMIKSPVAVTFQGEDVLVAEDYRLQRFDRTSQSTVIVNSFSVQPSGVAVTPSGDIAITDKASRTVRFFHPVGQEAPDIRWPDRLFGTPAGLAVVQSSGNVVVIDKEHSTVSTYSYEGRKPVLSGRIESDQFSDPTHVAVSDNGLIFVSDAGHAAVKVFTPTGSKVNQFALPSRRGTIPPCPHGLCVLNRHGMIAACDHEGHRIVLMTYNGSDAVDLLTSDDGLRYPCDVAVLEMEGGAKLLAVIESSSGLFGNQPHHALKMFAL